MSNANFLKIFLLAIVSLLVLLSLGATAGGKDQFPLLPAPDTDGKSNFGRIPAWSYQPLTREFPFGKGNCKELPVGRTMSIAAPPWQLNAFHEYVQRWRMIEVYFQGEGEDALDCMIFLTNVREARFKQMKELGLKEKKESVIYSYRNLVFLKAQQQGKPKLFWIPVLPNREEHKEIKVYLMNSARQIVKSMKTPVPDLLAQNVQFAVGYIDTWGTLYFQKNENGEIMQPLKLGIGAEDLGFEAAGQ